MSPFKLLLVAGTHGNEINAPWLFGQWKKKPSLINANGLNITKVIGNPLAGNKCQRYIDRDLNRSFSPELLENFGINDLETCRARELLSEHGPLGADPSQIVVDFHSTTSSMGSSIVIYGRRSVDLAIVSLIQKRLQLPIYLHEGDNDQTGFLVESWPCGFVVEIGPVPQGLIHNQIINQTFFVLQTCINEISNVINKKAVFPDKLIIHRYLKNIDFPRDSSGVPNAFVHSAIQDKDWHPINSETAIFINLEGDSLKLSNYIKENEEVVPVFINEAAYSEKNIAMILTKKEVLDFEKSWAKDLYELVNN